jgi:hypothetical protein
MAAETERELTTRRHQRTLFDGVAQLYDDSRLGYPDEIVEFAVATAGVGPGRDDPFGTAIRGIWGARTGAATGRVQGPHFADPEVVARTGLFEEPIHKTQTQRIVRSPEAVAAVENTRATSLSWPAETRAEFTAELRHQLRSQAEVPMTQQTSLTMARALTH